MPDYGIPLDDRYRIEPIAESSVTREDVLALWARENVVTPQEARRRIDEVLLVGVDRDDGVVGVSSAYLQRNEQLRMDLWYYRAFVARAHRMSSLAVLLAMIGRDLLKQRFVTGRDTRAAGAVYEVENEGLKRYFNGGVLAADRVHLHRRERSRGPRPGPLLPGSACTGAPTACPDAVIVECADRHRVPRRQTGEDLRRSGQTGCDGPIAGSASRRSAGGAVERPGWLGGQGAGGRASRTTTQRARRQGARGAPPGPAAPGGDGGREEGAGRAATARRSRSHPGEARRGGEERRGRRARGNRA